MPQKIRLGDKELFVTGRTAQRDNKLPQKPVQEGSDLSDHIEQKPQLFDLTVKVSGDTEQEIKQEINELKEMRDATKLFRYVSPEEVIENVAIQKVQDSRDKGKKSYTVKISLKEFIFGEPGNSSSPRASDIAGNGGGESEPGLEEETKSAGQQSNKNLDDSQAEQDANDDVIVKAGIAGDLPWN